MPQAHWRARRLSVADVRCWSRAELDLPAGLVVLSGPNGAGKTSLVEALVLGCLGISCRTAREQEMVRHGAPALHVTLELEGPDGVRRRDIGYAPRLGRRLALDGEAVRSLAAWRARGAVLVFLPDHRVLERYRYVIGAIAIGLLVATMVFGTEINGSRLWIQVGGGQTIQLGELAKVLMVLFLAGYLRDKREVLAIPTNRRLGIPMPSVRHLGPLLLFWGAALAAVVVLNDFGTALLFFGVFLAMIYLATGRAAYAGIGLGLFALGSVAIWAVVPRIGTRVDAWLDPFGDPQGKGYQMVQSLYALADGGAVGPGFGKSALVTASGQTRIPALPTDFIFSAVANDLGYIGAVGVLLLFLLVVARGFAIATAARDGFSKLLAGGLTAAIGLQAFLIIGGVIRLVPLTGVTLPFMSYGGSSVVTNFGLIALLLVISHRSRQSLLEAVGDGR